MQDEPISEPIHQPKFSLAGVQVKLSLKAQDGRYILTPAGELGDWIIKIPSTQYSHVPQNEYCAMQLASLAGVKIPPIQLISLDKVETLPGIALPNESWAYAIKRFDREQGRRVHIEDFAQVLGQFPQEKYSGGNYTQIGQILYRYSQAKLEDVQQLARRLLVNVLLANGDAYLKNWSLIYPDQVHPKLAPAYDIITTRQYLPNESTMALNLAKTKQWQALSMAHFKYWAEKIGALWPVIEAALRDTLNKAQTLWPKAMADLPITQAHRQTLKCHWRTLHKDFQLS